VRVIRSGQNQSVPVGQHEAGAPSNLCFTAGRNQFHIRSMIFEWQSGQETIAEWIPVSHENSYPLVARL